MLPHEIVEARDHSSCAFVPVSPCFEWHSYHLPLGTDAIISEALCMHMAERFNGIYFRPLSFGLDEKRSEETLVTWGFDPSEDIFGMRFPDVPVFSEYCTPDEMRKSVGNRLNAIRGSGFRYTFIVDHHLGVGQLPLLEEIASAYTNENYSVFSVTSYQFLTYHHELLEVGGHAGQSETLYLLAFRPEFVDISQLPDGDLEVKTMGILHDRPMIDEKYHPNKILISVANTMKVNILTNFECYVKEVTQQR